MMRLPLRGLAWPAVAIAVATVVGLVTNAWCGFDLLALGLLAYVLFHAFFIDELTRWANGSPETPVPFGRGSWVAAFAALHGRVRRRDARQRDLALALERFRSAVEALPEGMVALDVDNRIVWANAMARTHLGINVESDIGHPLINLVRQPAFIRYLANADFREPVVLQAAREVSLSLQVVPYGTDSKLLMSRNISQLERVSRLRRDFIANVSHELKTPLTVLVGFLETLIDVNVEPKERKRYLQLMTEQAKNMQRLVDDLLTLSTLESDQNVLHESEFDIAPLLERIHADAQALSAGQHDISLRIDDPARIRGSQEELSSAFANLVSNAVRYTGAGGRIDLSWRIDHGEGVFTVSDTGIGIAAEHLPRLTERFYRVDRSRSRETGGTGLGLAIVKHILLRHQAELEVKSELGRGSAFSVRFPAERVTVIEAEVASKEKPPSHTAVSPMH